MSAEGLLFGAAILCGIATFLVTRRYCEAPYLQWGAVAVVALMLGVLSAQVLYRLEGGPESGTTHVDGLGQLASEMGKDMQGLFLGTLRGGFGGAVAFLLVLLSALGASMFSNGRSDRGSNR